MKQVKLLLLMVALVTMSFNVPSPGLTDAERDFASKYLQETKEDLLKKVKGLSPEQLNFKADPNSWSIAECVEHIASSESNIFGFAQQALQQQADPSFRKDVKTSDEAVINMITDRTHKVKTQHDLEPTNKFGSFEASLKEFKTKRDDNIKYVKTTSDDLRNHYNDMPFGKIDTYQTILFMAAHSKRHTEQIIEVMNNPGFPKGKSKS